MEPRGSEFAEPVQAFEAREDGGGEPDPAGRVLRDEEEFVCVEAVAVPARVAPGGMVRLHFVFRPITARKAHWNNEAEEMVLWIEPPPGWAVENRFHTHPIPREVATQETRSLEVELRAPDRPTGEPVSIPGYALYYVCEDVNGICMYRRQDLSVLVGVEP